WLKEREGRNTPNWDMVSTCEIGGEPGLVLVEAKAHEGELNITTDSCGSQSENKSQIESAIREANDALNRSQCTRFSGWSLAHEKCYQVSNRFAWAWKVASLGTPVILVYLGFLNATEMSDRTVLTSAKQWERCVLDRSKGIVPAEIWGQKLEVA